MKIQFPFRRPKIKSAGGSESTDTAQMRGRRTFLERLGTGSVIVAFIAFGYQTIRSLIPNVAYELGLKFKVGLPSDIPEGMTFIEARRLYVFRHGPSYHAISGACTHLGCTVKYVKLNQTKTIERAGNRITIASEFHCPCHGSKFYEDGTNYDGPAPSPLKWHPLEISPDDGQLAVDMNIEVDQNYRLTV